MILASVADENSTNHHSFGLALMSTKILQIELCRIGLHTVVNRDAVEELEGLKVAGIS